MLRCLVPSNYGLRRDPHELVARNAQRGLGIVESSPGQLCARLSARLPRSLESKQLTLLLSRADCVSPSLKLVAHITDSLRLDRQDFLLLAHPEGRALLS